MNKDNAKDYLPLVQALAEGRTIQHQIPDGIGWKDIENVSFCDPVDCYRIKPEPRRAWVWWPPADKAWQYEPAIRITRDSVENIIRELGGYITEVAE